VEQGLPNAEIPQNFFRLPEWELPPSLDSGPEPLSGGKSVFIFASVGQGVFASTKSGGSSILRLAPPDAKHPKDPKDIPDPHLAAEIMNQMPDEDLAIHIEAVFDELSKENDKDRIIIEQRMRSRSPKTLKEIGQLIGGVSAERVRQREARIAMNFRRRLFIRLVNSKEGKEGE